MLKKTHDKKPQRYLYPLIFSAFKKKVEAKFTTIHTPYHRLLKDTDKPILGLNQVHKDEIVIVDEKISKKKAKKYVEIKEGDGLITDRTGVWLSIRSADCVPILMYDSEKKIIAAVHSGWRSTLKSISIKALKSMTVKYGTEPKNVFISLGPSICFNCFEVGGEVMNKFKFITKINFNDWCYQKNDKYFIDLKKIIISELILSEVPLSQIEDMNHCTHCQNLFPSYRAGAKRKRMHSLISLLK